MSGSLGKQVIALLLHYQRTELTASLLYERIALREKDQSNREALIRISENEREHAAIWAKYTGEVVKPNMKKVWAYDVFSRIFGYTFVIKLLEAGEYKDIAAYKSLSEITELDKIIQDEQRHERELHDLLNEERLKFIGDVVLGLNDALVELTGALAGLSFVLANTRTIALAGIITGTAATLSMAASNFLAERANGNPKALIASFYTGSAYLMTVVLLVLPYLLFPTHMYCEALGTMLLIAIMIIFVFNFYISVAKSESFWKNFYSMAVISMSVAIISFVIGLGAKALLGVGV